MRFVPDNTSSLEAMFKAMNECQLLHPDPDDSIDEDDGDDDHESVEYDVAHAEAVLGVETANNGDQEDDEAMDVVPGQFDDADWNHDDLFLQSIPFPSTNSPSF